MPQTLADIKGLMHASGLRPRRRLGQHFLHDVHHMDRIVAAARLTVGELVLEVGAGTGALTERLLQAGAQVVAVEIDRDLEPILRQRVLEPYGDAARILFVDVLAGKHQIHADVLAALAGRSFKLVANLPYQVASPLLINLLTQSVGLTEGVVMVQSEVADRMLAHPGQAAYGALTVLVDAAAHVQRIARLPRTCFWPPPKVASAVLHLRRRDPPLTADFAALTRTLQRLFGRRRKQLGTIIGRSSPLPEGVRPDVRPQDLTVEQFIALARAIG